MKETKIRLLLLLLGHIGLGAADNEGMSNAAGTLAARSRPNPNDLAALRLIMASRPGAKSGLWDTPSIPVCQPIPKAFRIKAQVESKIFWVADVAMLVEPPVATTHRWAA